MPKKEFAYETPTKKTRWFLFKKRIKLFLRNKEISIHRPVLRSMCNFMKKYFGKKELVGIEIGVEYGENSLQILKNLNIKKLYLIDPYNLHKEYIETDKGMRTKKSQSDAKKYAKKILKKYRNKIVWIKKISDDAVKDIKEKVDFIYIDGNHVYKYIKRDIKNYFPLVKKRGVFGGHDFRNCSREGGREMFGVLKAVLESFKEEELYLDSDWWIIKK